MAQTAEQVLKQAGREGWRVVSISPHFTKNPITEASWQSQQELKPPAQQQPYQPFIGDGNYSIQVMPPANSGLAQAAQEIIVAPAPTSEVATSYLQDALSRPDIANTIPLWGTQISAPSTAPQRDPADQARPSPFTTWTPITDKNSGRQGWQDSAPGGTGQIVWSPETTPDKATVIQGPDGNTYTWDGKQGSKPQLLINGKPEKGQYVPFGDTLYYADPSKDGVLTAVFTKPTAPEIPHTQQGPDGTMYQWDPKAQAWIKAPGIDGPSAITRPTVTTDAGVFQWNPDTKTYETAPGIPPPKGAKSTASVIGGSSATAPYIPILVNDDKGWHIEQAPNPNAITVDAALFDFTGTLRKMLGPTATQVPLDVAKDLATQVVNAMNAQTSQQQANNQGGQVGAGLLQQRAATAGNILDNSVSAAAGNKNFGLGGPLPEGLGQGLFADAQGFATQAMGGQSVMDDAAALVHRAAPSLQGTPQGAVYTAALAQMLAGAQRKVPAQPAGLLPAGQAGTAMDPRVANSPAFMAPTAGPAGPAGPQVPFLPPVATGFGGLGNRSY